MCLFFFSIQNKLLLVLSSLIQIIFIFWMHITHSTKFTSLFFSLIILVIMVAVSLVTLALLGYTGFQNTAIKRLPIILDPYCVNMYYYDKYETENLTGLLVRNYLTVFSSSLLGLSSLLTLISFVCRQQQPKPLKIREHANEELPTRCQTAVLYISILCNLIVSIFPFMTFLMIKVEEDNTICQLETNPTELRNLLILCSIVLLLNVVCMCLVQALRRSIVACRKIQQEKGEVPVSRKEAYHELSHHDSDEETNDIVRISSDKNIINLGADSIISFATTQNRSRK